MTRKQIATLMVLFAAVALTTALAGPPLKPLDKDKPVKRPPWNPYPGGSPFPPGKEPSLTHTAKVFWTTEGGVETLIDVVVKGNRPIQTNLGSMGPECNEHLRITAGGPRKRLDEYRYMQKKGSGTIEVRVHGFKAEDFAKPPTIRARYYDKAGKLLGETSVTGHPVPEKLKKKAGGK